MTIKEAAQHFDEQRKRSRVLYLIYGLGMLGGLALVFLQEMKSALLVFALLIILYFVIVRSTISQYTAEWREYCARRFAETFLPESQYSYKGKVASVPAYSEHSLMPMADQVKPFVRNLVTGETEGIRFALFDVTIPVGQKKGADFLSGCWMGFEFECNREDTLRIIKEEMLADGAYERYMETEHFEHVLTVGNKPKGTEYYSSSGKFEISEYAEKQLRKLIASMHGSGVIEICKDGLFVFLPHRLLNRLPPSLKASVTESMIESMTFPEVEAAGTLARALKDRSSEE